MDRYLGRRRRFRGVGILLAAAVATFGSTLVSVGSADAAAARPPAEAGQAAKEKGKPPKDRVENPDAVLGSGWRTSDDRAVTVVGDNVGLHVLVAEEAAGYAWRELATLDDRAVDVDSWIGQSCVTGSGTRAAVVYAPRAITNRPGGMEAGGRAAIIDLHSGAVTRLPVRVSLAFFNPGCGTDEHVAFTSMPPDGSLTTSVVVVDAATGAVGTTVTLDGQITSAVPMSGALVAANGTGLVSVSTSGAVSQLTREGRRPERLHPDAGGGVGYQVVRGDNTEIYRLSKKKASLLGTATKGTVRLSAGAGGRVFVVGPQSAKIAVAGNAGWSSHDVVVTGEPSTTGALVVTETDNHTGRPANRLETSQAGPVVVKAVATATRASLSFEVSTNQPASSPEIAPATTLPKKLPVQTQLAPDVTDPDRGCAVSRNDQTKQAYQATAEQVEWAADLAVKGALTVSRPNNFHGGGLPPYQIQGGVNSLFPLHSLHGGGSVPAQVLLGVLAQESNTLHASPHAVDGETGNFNQGFYYGDWISWSTVDCGYGVGQITTGMAMGDTSPWNLSQQLAIATDYASNIAASTNMLIDKWNQLYDAGILANGGDPQYISNWYLAAWAYNTGVQPASPTYGNTTGCTPSSSCTDGQGHWGLGWSNNPVNPIYGSDRDYFDGWDAYDTKHPNFWPYQEKVMGWAYHPVARYDYANQYWEPAYTATNTLPAIPAEDALCSLNQNQCNPTQRICTLSNLHCWWHYPLDFVISEGCVSFVCGIEVLRFHAGDPEPAEPAIYPPVCVGGSFAGLPTGAKIIDDVETDNPVGPCVKNWTSAGSFALTVPSAPDPGCTSNCIVYYGKIDLHQIGASGFNGHLWFTHTVQSSSRSKVTGTWTLDSANRLNGWGKVMVHIPKTGAWTQQAHYTINTGLATRHRYINTHFFQDRWVTLGAYQFSNAAAQSVVLSNVTDDGRGVDDIAWDAVAFVPLPEKPADMVAVIGDSYISGEGAGSYSPETDRDFTSRSWNACRRSAVSWPKLITLPGRFDTVGTLLSNQDTRLDFQDVSCSGATANQMMSPGVPSYWTSTSGSFHDPANGQFGEKNQIDSGVLSADTTLVLLSAGGNDAGFSNAVQACIAGNCVGNEATYRGNVVTALGLNSPPQSPTGVRGLITAIKNRAPNATIMLVGYPRLLADQSTVCDGLLGVPVLGVGQAEARMLNRVAKFFRDSSLELVRSLRSGGTNIQYVDMINGLGDHGTCQVSGPEYITNAMLADAFPSVETGEFQWVDWETFAGCYGTSHTFFGYTFSTAACVSRSSYHPTAEGHIHLRDAVNAALQAARPSGAWRLREGSGTTAADSSYGSHPASLTATTWTSAGPVLGVSAATFNGTSSYGATASSVVTTNRSFTVSAWVRLTDTTAERTAVSQNSGTGNQSGFYLEYSKSANRWRFMLPASDSAGATKYSADSLAAPTTGAWTHLTGVYDWVNNKATLYVNGVAQKTVTNVSTFNATGALRIGRSGSTWWKGDLSDVQVFPYAMSAGAVADLAMPPLVADFELNQSLASSPIAPYWTNPTLTTTGGATWGVEHDVNDRLFGAIDGADALSLDGVTGYASTTALLDTSKSFTVTAWVRMDDYVGSSTAVSQNSATGNQSGFSLMYDDTSRVWRFKMPAADTASPTIYKADSAPLILPPTGAWVHLAGVYDAPARQIKLYVNGSLVATTSNVTSFNATGAFRIGRDGSAWWAGNIDAVRVYAGALTLDQITAIGQYV